MSRRRKSTNYLSNSVLLQEINKSKISFCSFLDDNYKDFDYIVSNLSEINDTVIAEAKIKRAIRLNNNLGDDLFENKKMSNKQIDAYIEQYGFKAENIKNEELVFRVMTNEHVPTFIDKKNREVKTPVNFPAFQHYSFCDNQLKCVGKSHWKDGLHNGEFSTKHGRVTRKLGDAYVQLAERYSRSGNWRGYSYIDEMRSEGVVRLCQTGLTFNEMKSDNPFSYLTQILLNIFTATLNKEKELAKLRNQLIVEQGEGYQLSFSQQADQDNENYLRDNAPMLVKSE